MTIEYINLTHDILKAFADGIESKKTADEAKKGLEKIYKNAFQEYLFKRITKEEKEKLLDLVVTLNLYFDN